MPKFTEGKWQELSPLFLSSTVFVPSKDKGKPPKVVAMDISNPYDARLIAAAPEMYELLNALVHREYDNTLTTILTSKAEKLLARIDGEEEQS